MLRIGPPPGNPAIVGSAGGPNAAVIVDIGEGPLDNIGLGAGLANMGTLCEGSIEGRLALKVTMPVLSMGVVLVGQAPVTVTIGNDAVVEVKIGM